MTDSEQVLRRKGEREPPLKRIEIDYEIICLQSVGGRLTFDRVPVEEWASDLDIVAWLRRFAPEP